MRPSHHRSLRRLPLLLAALLSIVPAAAAAAQYSTVRAGDVVRLEDAKNQTVVSLVTSVGNIAFEMKVKGQNVLRWPYASVEEFKARPGMSGIPFLGPWANRLDEQAFYANGRKYSFDMELGNVRGAIPIHGFLTTNSRWQVVEAKADRTSAWVTSRLDFFREPLWMKQFPFAHTIQMTHRLENGVLQVTTRIQNLSTEPMPVAIGFHPYFQLTDSTRDEWTISVGARTRMGACRQQGADRRDASHRTALQNPNAVRLRDYDLDHVFGDLVRDGSGRAVMTLKGRRQRLDVWSVRTIARW